MLKPQPCNPNSYNYTTSIIQYMYSILSLEFRKNLINNTLLYYKHNSDEL